MPETSTVPARVLDETGHTYGRLRVLSYAGTEGGGKARWLCLCDPDLGGCGALTVSRGCRLRQHRTVSCGCWRASREVRQSARLKVSPKRRRAIAQSGAAARWTTVTASNYWGTELAREGKLSRGSRRQ